MKFSQVLFLNTSKLGTLENVLRNGLISLQSNTGFAPANVFDTSTAVSPGDHSSSHGGIASTREGNTCRECTKKCLATSLKAHSFFGSDKGWVPGVWDELIWGVVFFGVFQVNDQFAGICLGRCTVPKRFGSLSAFKLGVWRDFFHVLDMFSVFPSLPWQNFVPP